MAELILSVIFHTITQIGSGTAATVQKPFLVRIPLPILQIKLAKNKIMANLAISAGCTDIPRFNHRLAPLASIPYGVNTNIIKTADAPYPITAKRSQK